MCGAGQALAQADAVSKAFQPSSATAAAPVPPACAANSTVTAGSSSVCGIASAAPGVFAYEGIRYANAARWTAPVAAPLPATLNATQFGNVCPQMKDKVPVGAEDCLFVNVWAPASAINAKAKLPVMVFIHGGAFLSGAGSSGLYDGSAAAAQGVVVVTLNYRLGALGFMAAHPYVLAKSNAAPSAKTNPFKTIGGNFGLMDQQTAMQWVVNNISAFGGDPSQITLFGESAGAMSVALHTFDIPTSAPLFQRAIMESNPAGLVYRSKAASLAQGDKFLKYMCKTYAQQPLAGSGAAKSSQALCLNPAWLDKLNWSDIVSGQLAFYPKDKTVILWDLLTGVFGMQSLPWQPVVDGSFVTGQAYDGYSPAMPKSALGKTLAMGTNGDEGTIFTAFAYSPKTFTQTSYNALLALKFKAQYPAIVLNPRYRGDKQTLPPGASAFENQYSAAFANVMTDYAFTCGNLHAANQAITKGSAVYAYHFTQAPFYDLYNQTGATPAPDKGACAPSSGYTCHGNELTYVFSTFAYLTGQDSAYKPTTGDTTLTAAMNTAWVNFAKGNTTPATGWTPYAAGEKGIATLWNSNTPNATLPLDKASSCTAIWLQAAPYNPAAATSTATKH